MSENQNDELINVKPLGKNASGFDILEVPSDKIVETVKNLKTNVNARFDMLLSVSGVDNKDSFDVVYHLYSTVFNTNLILKVKLSKDSPSVNTLTEVYPAADWHERETYDLFGIIFNGHPNLERILLPKDWKGHPLRKDYVQNDERLNWNKR